MPDTSYVTITAPDASFTLLHRIAAASGADLYDDQLDYYEARYGADGDEDVQGAIEALSKAGVPFTVVDHGHYTWDGSTTYYAADGRHYTIDSGIEGTPFLSESFLRNLPEGTTVPELIAYLNGEGF